MQDPYTGQHTVATETMQVRKAMEAMRAEGPTGDQRATLRALQSRPTYSGTADPTQVAKRHAKAKAARKARRRNR